MCGVDSRTCPLTFIDAKPVPKLDAFGRAQCCLEGLGSKLGCAATWRSNLGKRSCAVVSVSESGTARPTPSSKRSAVSTSSTPASDASKSWNLRIFARQSWAMRVRTLLPEEQASEHIPTESAVTARTSAACSMARYGFLEEGESAGSQIHTSVLSSCQLCFQRSSALLRFGSVLLDSDIKKQIFRLSCFDRNRDRCINLSSAFNRSGVFHGQRFVGPPMRTVTVRPEPLVIVLMSSPHSRQPLSSA